VVDHVIGAAWGQGLHPPDGFAKHKVSAGTDVERSNRPPDAVSTAAQPCDREDQRRGEEYPTIPRPDVSAREGIDALCVETDP
jgi:hypothetical protein